MPLAHLLSLSHTSCAAAVLGMALFAQIPVHAVDTSASEQLQRWSVEASKPGHANTGLQLFNTRHGAEWSCASCHNSPPATHGKHAAIGKAIAPVAPAFNHKGFTDTAKVDK